MASQNLEWRTPKSFLLFFGGIITLEKTNQLLVDWFNKQKKVYISFSDEGAGEWTEGKEDTIYPITKTGYLVALTEITR